MNNGQMDRGNENPTQHLPWWLRKTTKKPQSGWSAPGLEPGTSRMRVSCVTTEPPRSVVCFSFVFVEKKNLFSYVYKIIYLFYSRMSSQPTGVDYKLPRCKLKLIKPGNV